MMDCIRADLALLGIRHDLYSSEAELQESGAIEAAVAQLRGQDLVYEGVLAPPKGELPDDWEPVELTLFRSTRFGDDVDRPLRKSNCIWPFFGSDPASIFPTTQNSVQLIHRKRCLEGTSVLVLLDFSG